jgi:hypothetical protein
VESHAVIIEERLEKLHISYYTYRHSTSTEISSELEKIQVSQHNNRKTPEKLKITNKSLRGLSATGAMPEASRRRHRTPEEDEPPSSQKAEIAPSPNMAL